METYIAVSGEALSYLFRTGWQPILLRTQHDLCSSESTSSKKKNVCCYK